MKQIHIILSVGNIPDSRARIEVQLALERTQGECHVHYHDSHAAYLNHLASERDQLHQHEGYEHLAQPIAVQEMREKHMVGLIPP